MLFALNLEQWVLLQLGHLVILAGAQVFGRGQLVDGRAFVFVLVQVRVLLLLHYLERFVDPPPGEVLLAVDIARQAFVHPVHGDEIVRGTNQTDVDRSQQQSPWSCGVVVVIAAWTPLFHHM